MMSDCCDSDNIIYHFTGLTLARCWKVLWIWLLKLTLFRAKKWQQWLSIVWNSPLLYILEWLIMNLCLKTSNRSRMMKTEHVWSYEKCAQCFRNRSNCIALCVCEQHWIISASKKSWWSKAFKTNTHAYIQWRRVTTKAQIRTHAHTCPFEIIKAIRLK